MNIQHTPAPWTAHDDDGTGTLPCVLSDKVNKGGNFYVAQCNRYEDACLIAASPDLLDALKNLMTRAAKDAEKYAPEGNEPIWAFISDAADAIAKAKPPWSADEILKREG